MQGLSVRTLLSFVLLLLMLSACQQDGKKNIRDYYFPLKKLQDGLCYAYETVRHVDTQGTVLRDTTYWYYRSIRTDSAIYLTGTYYGSFPAPQQFVREEMVGNGMLLAETYLYSTLADGRQIPVPVKVVHGNVFPFAVSDSGGIFLYKTRFAFPSNPEDTLTLIKNRSYLGDTTFVYEGKSRPAVLFSLRELIESGNDSEGYVEPQYPGSEIYAKGIGLVFSEKKISPELGISNRLLFTCDMETLERIFKKKYPQALLQAPPQ